MREIKGHGYTWTKSWIEFKAPNSQGVYFIQDKDGRVIFVGSGNIRMRLLSHWNQENPADAAICSYAPATFRFELTDHPAERVSELIHELKPACNPVTHSRFPKFW